MQFSSSKVLLILAALGGLASTGCEIGGVGDPCIPEDEYRRDFPGYDFKEVNVESRSFQCETRVCLAAYFHGRVSCPYGQTATTLGECTLPDTGERVEVVVPAQFMSRQRSKAVYCSCRCAGSDKNARYCECPSGYTCQRLVPDYGLSSGQLSGSYCVKEGTTISDPTKEIVKNSCFNAPRDCGDKKPKY